MRAAAVARSSGLDLLVQICEWEPAETTRQRMLASEDVPLFEQLIALGALKHIDNADTVLCTACDDVHTVMVDMPSAGCFRAYCPEAGYYDVPADDLKVFALDPTWIAEVTARGLDIPTRIKIVELLPSLLWWMGERRFGKSVPSIYFARLVDRPYHLRDIEAAINNRRGKPPGIIFTSTRREALPSIQLPRHLLLPVADYAELRAAELVFDQRSIERALKGEAYLEQAVSGGVIFSPDYRHVTVGTEVYTFTPKQAEAVRVMHAAHKQGVPKLGQRHILAEADSDQKRMAHLFPGHPAFGAFILHDGKGFYWLDL